MTIPNTINYMQEYFERSGIHGVQYFLEKKRTRCEKFFWIVVFIISITLCFFVIFETYQTWNENAVGLVISNKKMLIYDIPFPAITICPVSKIPKFNCSKSGLKYAYMLCDDDEYDLEEQSGNYICKKCNYTYNWFEEGYFNQSTKLFDFMDQVKPTVFFRKCRFQKERCTKNDFTPLITRKGFCYTFNILKEENIFQNSVWHYPLNLNNLIVENYFIDVGSNVSFSDSGSINEFINFYNDADPHPKRQFYQGQQYGLQLNIVTPQTEIDNCTSSHLGYEIFVHDSLSLPGQNSFKLLLNESKSVKVNPLLTNISDSIRKYSIEKRKCYFQNERPLQYFKIYTKSNCEMECWTNYSLAHCGCIHFSMPTTNGTRICGSFYNMCATIIARELTTGDVIMEEIKNGYSSIGTQSFLDNRKNFGDQAYLQTPNCKCLPSCSNVEYNSEIISTKLEDEFVSKYFERKETNAHLSTLYVFFGKNEVIGYVRKELYGPVDFLANFGGLLGLFCGFSILSLVEMLYFMTVRIICNKITYGQWSGQK